MSSKQKKSRIANFARGVICAALLAGLITREPAARAEDTAALENQVKAGCIINFIQFTDFPEGALGKADEPIVIGIVDPFPPDAALVAAVEGKTIKGHKLVIQHFTAANVGKCHVLLVGGANATAMPEILKKAAAAGALTVGDSENFTDAGGVIRLYLEDRKVRFEVNLTAAEKEKLSISSKLLKLAKVVNK